jgi:lactam utilization protein B
VVPLDEWHGRLRQLLTDMPVAIVGGEWTVLHAESVCVAGRSSSAVATCALLT